MVKMLKARNSFLNTSEVKPTPLPNDKRWVGVSYTDRQLLKLGMFSEYLVVAECNRSLIKLELGWGLFNTDKVYYTVTNRTNDPIEDRSWVARCLKELGEYLKEPNNYKANQATTAAIVRLGNNLIKESVLIVESEQAVKTYTIPFKEEATNA